MVVGYTVLSVYLCVLFQGGWLFPVFFFVCCDIFVE